MIMKESGNIDHSQIIQMYDALADFADYKRITKILVQNDLYDFFLELEVYCTQMDKLVARD